MIQPPSSVKPGDVLSVSQLNRLARQLIEDCFPMIWVEGEISNLSRPSSGHWYFTLKDSGAQVRCAMFRARNIRLKFQPVEGSKIMLKGTLSLYEARGDYQLIAEDMQPAGQGLLAAKFEQLKQKLQTEGLFDPSRKKPVPAHPRHIAVITSATGAAIHDILTVLKRRSPSTRITLIPVPVQGEQAPGAIARAIVVANTLVATGEKDFDVILAGRGGGSLEDLWAFNDERVARAIAASGLPIVSAVGHEVDFTIADFVADVRAATPSAAAELLSTDQREYAQKITALRLRLINRWQHIATQTRQRISWHEKRLQTQHPGQRLRQRVLRLDELELRSRQAMLRAAGQTAPFVPATIAPATPPSRPAPATNANPSRVFSKTIADINEQPVKTTPTTVAGFGAITQQREPADNTGARLRDCHRRQQSCRARC
jgi:exodeoxyribonuclease VII large subunit